MIGLSHTFRHLYRLGEIAQSHIDDLIACFALRAHLFGRNAIACNYLGRYFSNPMNSLPDEDVR
jgi:hypothetical protein